MRRTLHRNSAGNWAGLLAALAIVAILALAFSPAPAGAALPNQSAGAQNALQYVLVGWNDLGMHCMNLLFHNLAVLPPFNTQWAQVIQRADPPVVTTQGITVSYTIRNNTDSVSKTDFWTYAPALFGANLPPNVGLAGKSLADTMDNKGDHFVAVGIPLTPFLDGDTTHQHLYPFNLVDMVAKDSNGNILATTTDVAPVSTEMHCDYCHADGKEGGEGNLHDVELNILWIHDHKSGTNLLSQTPVLCANCHGSNALGMAGDPNLPNLSRAMHGFEEHRQSGYEGPGNFPVCYNCHPGPETQCLRDVMYQHGMTCTDCHGTMAQVASPTRDPWKTLPQCGSCHGAKFAENPGVLFRNSIGHGGLYCEACHGSTHAVAPSAQYNDNIQNVALQGYAGALGKCTVCHVTQPAAPGPHGLVVPKTPTLKSPRDAAILKTKQPVLSWVRVPNRTSYRVEIRRDTADGLVVGSVQVKTAFFKPPRKLAGGGTTYFWSVQACNLNICSDWSARRSFTIKTP